MQGIAVQSGYRILSGEEGKMTESRERRLSLLQQANFNFPSLKRNYQVLQGAYRSQTNKQIKSTHRFCLFVVLKQGRAISSQREESLLFIDHVKE